MNSLRVLHVADVHLGVKFRGLPPAKARNRREDLKKTFSKMIDLAKSSRSNVLLIAGDLFDDPHPSQSLVSLVINEMKRAEIPVFLIPGNHDPMVKGSVYTEYDFPSNVTIFDTEFSSKTVGDLAVHGIAYDPEKFDKHILKNLPEPLPDKYNIALVHGSYKFMDFGDENYYPIEKEEIEGSKMDYIALGHFHTFHEIKTSVPACYPGTPEGLGFNDTGKRGVVLVDLDKNRVRINSNNINSRVYETYELECTDLVNEMEIGAKICEHSDPNKILRVKLFGVPETLIKLDSDALLEEIENSFFHLEIIDNITSPSDLQVDNTIKGAFINKIGKDQWIYRSRREKTAGKGFEIRYSGIRWGRNSMKLRELFVQGFGQFGTQRTINFKDGVNIIIGPNESGKSTLHNAILASLFAPGKAELDSCYSWSNPDVCKVKLTYQTSNGEVYRISRDLKSKKVLVEKQDGVDFTEVTRTEKEAKKIISDHVGFPEKRVFENTVCVTQGEMAALKEKIAIKQIKDIISNLITGTEDTSANKAIEILDKKIKEIDGGPRSNGILGQINSEIKENNSSLDEAKRHEKSTLDLKEKQKAIEENIVSKESHFKKYESIKIKYDAIKKLQDENSNKKEVLQTVMNNVQKIKEINKEIEGIEEELEKFPGYEKISNETISDLKSLENKKNGLQRHNPIFQ